MKIPGISSVRNASCRKISNRPPIISTTPWLVPGSLRCMNAVWANRQAMFCHCNAGMPKTDNVAGSPRRGPHAVSTCFWFRVTRRSVFDCPCHHYRSLIPKTILTLFQRTHSTFEDPYPIRFRNPPFRNTGFRNYREKGGSMIRLK